MGILVIYVYVRRWLRFVCMYIYIYIYIYICVCVCVCVCVYVELPFVMKELDCILY
jgi:hypothetical protein